MDTITITQPIAIVRTSEFEADLSAIAEWLQEQTPQHTIPDATEFFGEGEGRCPRCRDKVRPLDSTAFVIDGVYGDTLSIHAGCIEDADEVLEYFGYGEKVQPIQADWAWCYEDGKVA